MMRWLFNIFALLSFLLCVATVVLWVRSYGVWNRYSFDTAGAFVNTNEGVVYFGESWMPPSPYSDYIRLVLWDEYKAHFLGIGVQFESSRFGNEWCGRVPFFWIAYVFAGLPILWCFSFYRRTLRPWRRIKNNQCVACGYDMQASPGACPECGVTHAVGVAVESD